MRCLHGHVINGSDAKRFEELDRVLSRISEKISGSRYFQVLHSTSFERMRRFEPSRREHVAQLFAGQSQAKVGMRNRDVLETQSM